MGDKSLLNNVKLVLRSLVISCPHGMTISDLQRDYKKIEGMNIPYEKLGFPTLESFLKSLSGALEVRGSGPMAKVYAPESKENAHITKMISNQRNVDRNLKYFYKYPVKSPPLSSSFQQSATSSSSKLLEKNKDAAHSTISTDRHLISVAKVEPFHPLSNELSKLNMENIERQIPISSTETTNTQPLNTSASFIPRNNVRNNVGQAGVFVPSHKNINNSLIRNVPHQYHSYNVPYQGCFPQYSSFTNYPSFPYDSFHGQYPRLDGHGNLVNYAWNNYNSQRNYYVPPSNYYMQNCAARNFLPQEMCHRNAHFKSSDQQLPPGLSIGESVLNQTNNIGNQENNNECSRTEVANTNIIKELNSMHIHAEKVNASHNNEEVEKNEKESLISLKNKELIHNSSGDSSISTNSSFSKNSKSSGSSSKIKRDNGKNKWESPEGNVKPAHVLQAEFSEALPELDDDDIIFLLDFPIDTVTYGEKILTPEIPEHIEVGKPFPLFINEVHNPYKFWFHFYKKDHELDELMNNLQNVYKSIPLKELQMKKNHIKREQICTTLYQNVWHRAEIIRFNIKEDEVVVFFFDYGTVSTVKSSDIKYLLKEFSSLPYQAFRGCLSQIKPISTRWSRDATISFLCSVRDIPILAMPTEIDYEEKVIYMTLADTTRDKTKDFQINESLIHKGYAKYDPNFRGNHSKVTMHSQVKYPTFEMLEKNEYPTFVEISNLLAEGYDFEAEDDDITIPDRNPDFIKLVQYAKDTELPENKSEKIINSTSFDCFNINVQNFKKMQNYRETESNVDEADDENDDFNLDLYKKKPVEFFKRNLSKSQIILSDEDVINEFDQKEGNHSNQLLNKSMRKRSKKCKNPVTRDISNPFLMEDHEGVLHKSSFNPFVI